MKNKTFFIKWIRKPNTQIALFAILISTFGLLFSVYYNCKTLKLTKIHNELSVRPILHVSIEKNKVDSFVRIRLENKGLGPAILKHLDYVYEKTNYSKNIDFLNLIRNKAIQNGVNLKFNHRQLYEGFNLFANESIELMTIFVEQSTFTDSITGYLEYASIEFKYSDIYNNEFHDEIEL
jgi:hypothetical protein